MCLWSEEQSPYSIWQAHTLLCAWANSHSWVSWLIDWLIDQQIKLLNSSSWWKHSSPVLIIFAVVVLLDSLNMGSQILSDRDFRAHLKGAGAYLCSMWLPVLSCFSNTVNGSFSLARWEVMCKRECGHANTNRPYSTLDWLLSVSQFSHCCAMDSLLS